MTQHLIEVYRAELENVASLDGPIDQAFLNQLEQSLANVARIGQILEFDPDKIASEYRQVQETQVRNEQLRPLLQQILDHIQEIDQAGYSQLTAEEWQYLAHVPHDEDSHFDVSDVLNVVYVRIKEDAINTSRAASRKLRLSRQAAEQAGRRLTAAEVSEIIAPMSSAKNLAILCGQVMQETSELEEMFGLQIKVKLVREQVKPEPLPPQPKEARQEAVQPKPEVAATAGVLRFLSRDENNALNQLGIHSSLLFRLSDKEYTKEDKLEENVHWVSARTQGSEAKYLTLAGIQKLHALGLIKKRIKLTNAINKGWLPDLVKQRTPRQSQVEVAKQAPAPAPINETAPAAASEEHEPGKGNILLLLEAVTARNESGFVVRSPMQISEYVAGRLNITDPQEIAERAQHLAVSRSKFIDSLTGEQGEFAGENLGKRLKAMLTYKTSPQHAQRVAMFEQVAAEYGHMSVEQFIAGVLQRFDKKLRADMYDLESLAETPIEQRVLVLHAEKYLRLGIDYIQNQRGYQFRLDVVQTKQFLRHVVRRMAQQGGRVNDENMLQSIDQEREFLGWREQVEQKVSPNANYMLARDLVSRESIKAELALPDEATLLGWIDKAVVPFLGITTRPLKSSEELLAEYEINVNLAAEWIESSHTADLPFDLPKIAAVRSQLGKDVLAFFVDRKECKLKNAQFIQDLIARRELGFVDQNPALIYWLVVFSAIEKSLEANISKFQREKLNSALHRLNECWNALYKFNTDPNRK